MKKNLTLLVWPAIAGLLAALLILDRWIPPLTPGAQNTQLEPVSYAAAVREATPAVVNIYSQQYVESSIDKFTSASFTVVTEYDRVDEGLGRQQITEGVLVLVPKL